MVQGLRSNLRLRAWSFINYIMGEMDEQAIDGGGKTKSMMRDFDLNLRWTMC